MKAKSMLGADPQRLNSGQIHHPGVILKDHSPEGSCAYRHDWGEVHIRCTLDPSQAQDDPFEGKFKLSPNSVDDCQDWQLTLELIFNMEPNAFVAEVYRRMSLRHSSERAHPSFAEIQNDSRVLLAVAEYAPLLPKRKDAAILDIGFGGGWFIASCVKLGYTNISGADFGVANKAHVRDWAVGGISLHEIERDIGDFLSQRAEEYDFIHMSHVIEHIPKYSLLWVVDAIFRALKKDGVLLLRTPNMEGPTPNSSLYVTLAHEYGFAGSNLQSLLDICGFDDITFRNLPQNRVTLKQRLGSLLRRPLLAQNKLHHRLFGVNQGGQFGTELIVSARRGDVKPLFDPKYK